MIGNNSALDKMEFRESMWARLAAKSDAEADEAVAHDGVPFISLLVDSLHLEPIDTFGTDRTSRRRLNILGRGAENDKTCSGAVAMTVSNTPQASS